jgi:protein SCO1/2
MKTGGLRDLLCTVLIAICGIIAFPLTTCAQQTSTIGGGFSLTDGAGRMVTENDFHGRFLLVFFGYTDCPDVCPVTMNKIARAFQLMGSQAAQTQPLFITVDPTHDTPALVGKYAALFSSAIIGLSGTSRQVEHVEREYHVYVGPRDPKTGAIDHTAILYVMSPDGSFLSALPNSLSAAELAASLMNLTAVHSKLD